MASSTPDAYRECRALARSHYENFPVASHLLPRRMRDPVAAIYVFARRADDLADEGTFDDEERLAALAAMAADLDATAAGRPPDDALWQALADAIPRFGLPLAPFHDLLSAFRQDVTQHRFDSFDDLRDYARRSADPVGRLLLRLADQATPNNIADSDRICTGLQLINFLQDLHQDFIERDRLYIPRADLAAFGVSEARLRSGAGDADIDALLAHQIERAGAVCGAPPARAAARAFRPGNPPDRAWRLANRRASADDQSGCAVRAAPARPGRSRLDRARAAPWTDSGGRAAAANRYRMTAFGSAPAQAVIRSVPWRCRETAPASVTSTV